MTKRYHFLFVLILLLLAGILIWQYQEKKVITVGVFAGSNWNVPEGNSYAVVDEAIKAFKAEHPGVEVRYVSGIKKEDYSEWLAEKFIRGEEPDVFLILADDFNLYTSIKALEPLNKYMDTDKDFHSSLYYTNSLDYGRYGDKQYALPMASVPMLMFVNKTLLAKENIPVPKNDWRWQDFLNICQQVTKDTDGDGVIDQYGAYDYNWRLAVISNGVRLFRDDGRTSYFADTRVEEAVKFVMAIKNLNKGHEPTARDFDMGKVAFRPFSFAEYRTYRPYPWKIKKYTTFEWDLIKFPAGPQGGNISPLSTLLVGVSARSREKTLSWEFLKKLCYDSTIQAQVLAKTPGLPVRRDVVESSEAKEILTEEEAENSQMSMDTISEVMDAGLTAPKFKNYNAIMLKADTEIQRIINGTVSLNNAFNKLQKEINAYLQQ